MRLRTAGLAAVVTCDAISRQAPLGENRVRCLLSAPKERWRRESHSSLARSFAGASAVYFGKLVDLIYYGKINVHRNFTR
uniref:Putative secreted protein n=1 Tax=Ixodes ricinus TaxID=34613 RepID=A0A147BML0_IXORI